MGQAEAQRSSGPADLCRAASTAVRGGPARVLPAVLAIVLFAAGAIAVILTVAPHSGPQPTLNEWVRGTAAGICVIIGVGSVLFLRGPRSESPARASDPGKVTALLSVAVLCLLLLVPAYLLAARTYPSTENWIGYGFFDKRWMVATFMLGSLGAMVVLTAMSQVVAGAATAPRSWRGWGGAAFRSAEKPAQGSRTAAISRVRAVGLAAAGLVLAAYFFAPPWHVALSAVNIHETPMMAGVQGIANGATPYIGSAAVQYGPGSELIHYLYLHVFGFNLESFRESTVLLFWLAASIFFVTVLFRLPLKLALITCFVSVLLFPALQVVSFQPNGSVDAAIDRLHGSPSGVWGWPNAMRYVGVFALTMWFPAVAVMRSRARVAVAGAGLGAVFGLTCYVSQENLVGGVIAVAMLALLLGISKTVPLKMLRQALVWVAAGFAGVTVIVLGYYAANGDLVRFLQLYYLIPPAVAAGYSDTIYYGGFDGHWGHLYYLLPFFLGALCVLAVIRLHPFRVPSEWSRERVLLVSALVAACVSHTGALLRADSSHMVNTMLALPVALTLAVAYLPGMLGISARRSRRLAAVGLAAITLAMLPLIQLKGVGDRLAWPLERFSYQSGALQWQRADANSIAANRLGPVLHRPGQWCCTYFRYPVSEREFAGILNRLHSVVGGRRVYVANFIDGMQPGAAYFLADLRPAPLYFEPLTMAMNRHLLDDFLTYFQDHISQVQAVVAVYPRLAEVRMFKAAYPNYRQIELPYSWGSITVLLR